MSSPYPLFFFILNKGAVKSVEYVIEMLNIRKEFPGIVANDNINLQVKRRNTRAAR